MPPDPTRNFFQDLSRSCKIHLHSPCKVLTS